MVVQKIKEAKLARDTYSYSRHQKELAKKKKQEEKKQRKLDKKTSKAVGDGSIVAQEGEGKYRAEQ